MTDQVCLDRDRDLCLEEYDFIYASFIQYPKLNDEWGEPQLDGVVALNRYDYMNDPNRLLIHALDAQDVIWKSAI